MTVIALTPTGSGLSSRSWRRAAAPACPCMRSMRKSVSRTTVPLHPALASSPLRSRFPNPRFAERSLPAAPASRIPTRSRSANFPVSRSTTSLKLSPFRLRACSRAYAPSVRLIVFVATCVCTCVWALILPTPPSEDGLPDLVLPQQPAHVRLVHRPRDPPGLVRRPELREPRLLPLERPRDVHLVHRVGHLPALEHRLEQRHPLLEVRDGADVRDGRGRGVHDRDLGFRRGLRGRLRRWRRRWREIHGWRGQNVNRARLGLHRRRLRIGGCAHRYTVSVRRRRNPPRGFRDMSQRAHVPLIRLPRDRSLAIGGTNSLEAIVIRRDNGRRGGKLLRALGFQGLNVLVEHRPRDAPRLER